MIALIFINRSFSKCLNTWKFFCSQQSRPQPSRRPKGQRSHNLFWGLHVVETKSRTWKREKKQELKTKCPIICDFLCFLIEPTVSYCPITKKNWVGRSTWVCEQIEQLEIYQIIYSVIRSWSNCWNHSPMIEAWQFFITAKSTSPLSPPTMKVSGTSERCSLKKYHTGKMFCQLPWIINTAWQLLAKQLSFLSEEWGPPAPLEIITHHKEHWKQRLTSFIKLKFIWKWSCFDATTMDSWHADLPQALSL